MHIPLPSSSSSSSSSNSVFTIPCGIYSEKFWDGNSWSTTYLTYPKYYYAGETLRETNCAFQACSDPDWDWAVTSGIWTLYIKNDGTYQSRFAGRTITRKPVGIGFYNALTRQRIVRSVVDLTNWDVTVVDDTIEWIHEDTGAVFRIRYVHDRVFAVVIIPQVVQDDLNASRPKWDEEDTCACIIYDADLDFLTEDIETEDFICHTNGSSRIRIGRRYVEHEDLYSVEGPEREVVSHLAWRKLKVYLPSRGLYVEACGLDAFTSKDGVIIFHDTDVFQHLAAGYSCCEDTYLDSRNPATNYCDSETIYVSTDYYGYKEAYGLIRFDLRDKLPSWPNPGAIFTGAILSLYCYDTQIHGESVPHEISGVWKEWKELNSNWNKFDASGDLNWDTSGCNHKSDYANFNSSSGCGYDRTSEHVRVTINESYENNWVDFDLHTSSGDLIRHLTRQYQSDHYEGFVVDSFYPGFNDYTVYFCSSKYSSDVTKRPKLQLTWELRSSSSSYSSCGSSFSCSNFSNSSLSASGSL